MKLVEKLKEKRFKKYWDRQGKKDLFTWVFRYLRLHSELLSDTSFLNLYNSCRNILVSYLRKDMNGKEVNDSQLEELIDALTDEFNENEPELVNQYKIAVDELNKLLKENPNILTEIYI